MLAYSFTGSYQLGPRACWLDRRFLSVRTSRSFVRSLLRSGSDIRTHGCNNRCPIGLCGFAGGLLGGLVIQVCTRCRYNLVRTDAVSEVSEGAYTVFFSEGALDATSQGYFEDFFFLGGEGVRG